MESSYLITRWVLILNCSTIILFYNILWINPSQPSRSIDHSPPISFDPESLATEKTLYADDEAFEIFHKVTCTLDPKMKIKLSQRYISEAKTLQALDLLIRTLRHDVKLFHCTISSSFVRDNFQTKPHYMTHYRMKPTYVESCLVLHTANPRNWHATLTWSDVKHCRPISYSRIGRERSHDGETAFRVYPNLRLSQSHYNQTSTLYEEHTAPKPVYTSHRHRIKPVSWPYTGIGSLQRSVFEGSQKSHEPIAVHNIM